MFGEIDVERINLVEKDGKVRLVISNVDRFPQPIVGKTPDRSVTVTLRDVNGRARLKLSVDVSGAPKIEFLDERGAVVSSLPGAAAQ